MYGLWNRLQYMLSPQFDIYEKIAGAISGRVVDIGCGTGFGTHLFTKNALNVTGIDVDPNAVKFAKRCFDNHKIKFFNMSVDDLIVIGNKFDFVTMIDVIEHVRDDDGMISKCKSLLCPTGILFVSTPNRLSRYRKSEYHVKEYSPDELRELLEKVFPVVDLLDYNLMPLESDHENPIIGMCQC